jgi:hypothetical protein
VVHLFDGSRQSFNVANDPGETTDLARAHSKRLKQLIAARDRYAKEVGVILASKAPYRP